MTHNINRRDFLKFLYISGLSLALGNNSQILHQNVSDLQSPVIKNRQIPNVMLIVLDTVRANNVSINGYDRSTTPFLEKLARNGVVFNHAISTSSWTLPSHASMFTGHFPNELSANWEAPLDNEYPTIAELFRHHQYSTAGFVGNNSYCSYEFGLQRGFEHYSDYKVSLDQMLMSSHLYRKGILDLKLYDKYATNNNFGRKSGEQVRIEFVNWLEKRNKNKPFFVFLNFFDSHDPYIPPMEFATKFTTAKPLISIPDQVHKTLDPQVLEVLVDTYDATIAYVDYQVRLIIEYLENVGILENTLLIITSDHGEHIGEKKYFLHGNSLYMPLIHVPLLMVYQGGIPNGIKVDDYISMRDLAATIIDLAGLDNTAKIPGKSLRRYWETNLFPEIIRSEFYKRRDDPFRNGEIGNWKSIIYSGMHYIKRPNGSEELYNLSEDPQELINLITAVNIDQWMKRFRDLS